MTPVFRYLIPALALAGLSACDREQKTAVKASADGEILDLGGEHGADVVYDVVQYLVEHGDTEGVTELHILEIVEEGRRDEP